MDDIEALCERVVIIDHGRIHYDGGLQQLVREVQPRKQVRATYADPISPGTAHDLPGVDPAHVSLGEDGRVLKLEATRERIGDVLERIPKLGAMVDLEVTDADVDEIIRDLFTREREVVS